jgi:hypothetical protein
VLNQLGEEIQIYSDPEDLTACCRACGVVVAEKREHICTRARQRPLNLRKPAIRGLHDHLIDDIEADLPQRI